MNLECATSISKYCCCIITWTCHIVVVIEHPIPLEVAYVRIGSIFLEAVRDAGQGVRLPFDPQLVDFREVDFNRLSGSGTQVLAQAEHDSAFISL